MTMQTAWLLALKVEGHWEYWQRHAGENGMPSRSLFRCDAYHFRTYEAALECTNMHPGLHNSDEWRIIPADRRRSLQKAGS